MRPVTVLVPVTYKQHASLVLTNKHSILHIRHRAREVSPGEVHKQRYETFEKELNR